MRGVGGRGCGVWAVARVAGIAVTCDNRYLREVRICLTRELSFRSCPEVDRRACRRDKVVMPPVRGG